MSMSNSTTVKPLDNDWQPPPYNELIWPKSACGPASEWYAAGLSSRQDLSTEIYYVRTDVITAYLRAILPGNETDKPSNSSLLVWYVEGIKSGNDTSTFEFANRMRDFPHWQCGQGVHFCNASTLDWQGDSDVTGPGMMVAYYMAASMAIIYFLVLAYDRVKLHWFTKGQPQPEHLSKAGRVTAIAIAGFRKSANTFVDALLYFSISMFASALARYSYILLKPDETYTIYGLLSSVFMSVFSAFPAIAVQAVAPGQADAERCPLDLDRYSRADSYRFRWTRWVLWGFAIAFAAAVDGFYDANYKAKGYDLLRDNNSTLVLHTANRIKQEAPGEVLEVVWLQLCDDADLRLTLEHQVMAAHAVLGVQILWWLICFARIVVSTWRGRRSGSKQSSVRKYPEMTGKATTSHSFRTRSHRYTEDWCQGDIATAVRLFDGLVCCVMMWLFLGYFHRYKHAVDDFSGNASEDSVWTFGQVLSVAVWVPVLVELVTFYLWPDKELLSPPEDGPEAEAHEGGNHIRHRPG